MKSAYQKPAYRHILLEETTTTGGCVYTHNYCWEVCPVELMPGHSAFSSKSNGCTMLKNETEAIQVICQMNGNPNSNVFGS